jgi:DNA invertase Pin-like site-specific DNA recombinase
MLIAIYSRKSKWTGRGESVENQVTMCREYIAQYLTNAEDTNIIVYEDEGFSGKNTKRPHFQEMMAAMAQTHYDYLVCYKLDRLGRNIIDLASLIEDLNKMETNFISIKEKFDTTTPIGKAMLYFSGVLAQMEREQIAERIRDNMVMLARDGRWLGGNTPLGFATSEEKTILLSGKSKKAYRLQQVSEEIDLVKCIFQEYLLKQSLVKVVAYCLKLNIKTRRGKEYTASTVRSILTNPVYCCADYDAYCYFVELGAQVCFDKTDLDDRVGLISYAKTSSIKYKSQDNPPEKWIISMGKHAGTIRGKEYRKVQKLLEMNKHKGDTFRKVQNEVALLSGLLFCSCGHAMRPKYYAANQVDAQGRRKFSYLCPYKDLTHGEKCSTKNIPGNNLDKLLCEVILRYTQQHLTIHNLYPRIKCLDYQIETTTEKALIQNQIKKKKEQIFNLLAAVAKSNNNADFVRQIEAQVAQLSTECFKLEEALNQQQKEPAVYMAENDLSIGLSQQLSSFVNIFEHAAVAEKREYIRIIIRKITWNGETAHVHLIKII